MCSHRPRERSVNARLRGLGRAAWPHVLRWGGLALVLTLTVAYFAGRAASQLEANNDTLRDLWRTYAWVHAGALPIHGPPVTNLPITLGRGWYALAAPAVWIDPNPYSVYAMHLVLFAGGLAVLYAVMLTLAGPAVAVLTSLALASSRYCEDVLICLWHTAALPGLALAWTGLVFLCLTSATPRGRAWALALAWGLQALMLDVHLIAITYAATLGLIQLDFWRREPLRAARVPNLLSAGAVVWLTVSYARTFLAVDWSAFAAAQGRASSAAPEVHVTESQTLFLQHLSNAWVHPTPELLASVTVLAIVIGLGRALWRPTEPRFERWLAVHALIGLAIAAVVMRGGAFARYLSGVMPTLFLLAGLGVGALLRPARVPRWTGGLLAGLLVLLTTVGSPSQLFQGSSDEPSSDEPSSDERDTRASGDSGPARDVLTLSLAEQSAAVEVLVRHHGLRWDDVESRVHGPLLVDSAARYLVLVATTAHRTSPEVAHARSHFAVLPPGFAEPAYGLQRERFDGGSGRSLTLIRFEPRFDPAAVQLHAAGVGCNRSLPFNWAPWPSSTELAHFGHALASDLAHCEGLRRAPLTIVVPAVSGKAPLTLQLSWNDSSMVGAAGQTVVARDTQQRALEVQAVDDRRLQHLAVYRITPPDDGPMTVEIAPADILANIDLY